MTIIGLRLSNKHLDYLRGLKSAAYMWKELVSVFQHQTLLNKLKGRHEFYTAHRKDDERVLANINRVHQLASSMKSIDITVDDAEIAMAQLCGLPDWIAHIIVAVDTVKSERELNFEFVKSRLLQEEQRLTEMECLYHHMMKRYCPNSSRTEIVATATRTVTPIATTRQRCAQIAPSLPHTLSKRSCSL